MKKYGLVKDLKRNYQFYIMTLPALGVVLLFIYAPMYGIQLALKDYKFLQGVSGSTWIGLEHFRRFFSSYSFLQVIGNTLRISISAILFGFPPPILFALLLNEVKNERFKKCVQTVTYIPHFISTTVLVAMLFAFCNQTTGIVNIFLTKLGLEAQPFMQSEKWFVFMFVISGVWQSTGYNSILYIATLSSVDPQLHEAAIIDGANRFQRIVHINLPALLPTIIVMLILRTGTVITVGFEKVYLMQNALNMNVSEVLSTYVYKIGLIDTRYDFSTTVNLFTSVVNCSMLLIVNWISNRVSKNGLW